MCKPFWKGGLVEKLPDEVVPLKIIPTKHDSAYEPVRGYSR